MAEDVVKLSRQEALDMTLVDFRVRLSTLMGVENLSLVVLLGDEKDMTVVGNVKSDEMAVMLTDALVATINRPPDSVKTLRRSS